MAPPAAEEEREVVIAGAGPAGVGCALALLQAAPSLAGRILVVDRARFPRTKPCGGGLTGHAEQAMAALGLALDVPSFPSPRATVRFGGIRREVALPRPVRVVRREELDASLVAQARARGVEVREGAGLAGFSVDGAGVTARLQGGGAVRARVLVGADGVGSLVRKHLVGHREDGDGPSPIRLFRAELRDEGAAAIVGDRMIYDFTPMADGLRGYLWLFPSPGGRVNVGLMHAPTRPLSGAALTALLARRLADHGVTIAPDEESLRGWPAWGYTGRGPVAAPRLLTVGDAAGIDALTGEGIAVGLEHGILAGGAIADGLASGDLSFARYGRTLRRATVGRELWIDGWLAWLLYDASEATWRRWLSLVLLDDELLGLYAARVSGALVLADHKRALIGALARHVAQGRARRRALEQALAAPAEPLRATASS